MQQLLTAAEVADRLAVHPATVRRIARRDPAFPRPYRVGQQRRWDPGEIQVRLESTREPAGRAARRPAEPAYRTGDVVRDRRRGRPARSARRLAADRL